jgi:hypothetical protein
MAFTGVKKTGATNQSRSSRPGQGPQENSAGRRPFRGVATGTAFLETSWVFQLTIGRFAESSIPMLTHQFGLSNGPVLARS